MEFDQLVYKLYGLSEKEIKHCGGGNEEMTRDLISGSTRDVRRKLNE